MRDREYSLFDIKNFSKAIRTNRIDSGTGVIMPIADVERGIVYFAGRVSFARLTPPFTLEIDQAMFQQGDMTLRWVEVGGPSILTEGNIFRKDPRITLIIFIDRRLSFTSHNRQFLLNTSTISFSNVSRD